MVPRAPSRIALTLLFLVAASLGADGALADLPEAGAGEKPGSLRVLIDDNYPPYIMRGEEGTLKGILIDQWSLFERETGIDVEIRAGNWADMLEEMASGAGDVIDTIFRTPEREAIFDFAPAYATINVPIFVSDSISGIADATSLKGFVVAVKAGDAAVGILRSKGIETLAEYPSYESVIEGARSGEGQVFCVDDPAARYYIYRGGLEHSFKEAFTLYSGEFHRAVRKGDVRARQIVERGFAGIPARELEAIDEKWMGRRIVPASTLRLVMWIVIAVAALAAFFLATALNLRFLVKRKTGELKKAVEELTDTKDDLEALVKSSPDLLFALDKEGRYLQFHARPEARPYLRPEDFLGKRLDETLPREIAVPAMEAIAKASATGSEQSMEYSLEMPDGIRDFEARFMPMKGQRIFAVVRDVTMENAAEAEAIKSQKLESLGLFAGGIAHDFNNILAAISGNVSLARMAGDDRAKADEFLAKAEAATMRARGLTDQLRTLSRGGEPLRKPADLARIARETAAFALSGQNCALDYQEGEGPFMAMADKGQISQVVQNLVFNASQAMPEGGAVRVRVDRVRNDGDPRASPSAGDFIEISVEDSGQGMPDAVLRRIFDPYYSTRKGGTGLGLSICHTIAKRHGGCVTAESEQGKGSIFRIRVPAMDPGDPAAEEPEADAPEPSDSFVKLPPRSLVMDDEPALRDLMSNLLRACGSRADAAAEGNEGLRLFDAAIASGEPYGLVIADLTVPGGMGGAEMMKRLRAGNARFKSIVMSGYAEKPILAEYLEHGFDGFLKKPFTQAEFRKLLRSLFDGETASAME